MTENAQDKLFKEDEVQNALRRSSRAALRDFEESTSKGESGKTVKLFGMFEMDAPFAALVGGLYNEGTRQLGDIISPKAYHLSEKLFGDHLKLKGKALARSSTVAAVGTNLVLGGGMYFYPLIQSFSEHRRSYKKLARAIAPVLEDICGNHSVGALMSVRQDGERGNEMIYAHRQRMALTMNVETSNRVIDLLVNVLPKIAATDNLKGMWTGEELKSTQAAAQAAAEAARVEAEKNGKAITSQPETTSAEQSKATKLMNWLWGSVSMGSSPIATYITSRNERKLEKNRRPYSALEMVLELDKQVAGDPKARSFTTPGHRGNSYSLEEYIARTMIHHQAEMADLSEQHAEIREALHDDLMIAAKKLAAAIRGGDINTLSLVRIIGEGRIIKKKGRSIASAAEVEDLVRHASVHQASYIHVDPADYYKDAAFTRDQLKSALKSLDGEERRIFTAMFPDAVLEEAGMSVGDIKAMREATANEYDKLIAEAVLGMNSKSDEELKADGLAKNEIQHIRDAYAQLQETGVDAVRDLKMSAANDHGIEHLITNATVHNMVTNPKHFGTLIQTGKEKLSTIATDEIRAGEITEAAMERAHSKAKRAPHPREGHQSHAEREDARRHAENTEEYGYERD